MIGKLIVIEGTDCSGKDTQARLLISNLRSQGINVERFSFPNYETPTGKIVGGPYLGKEQICASWFTEGSVNVDPKVAALYYAADRKYNIHKINFLLQNGIHVILDRYVYSNMAHQGCKINDKEERVAMYNWLEKLEYELLELPRPDIAIFLHMPAQQANLLKLIRTESLDTHEQNNQYLEKAEQAYLELKERYQFVQIECSDAYGLRSKEEIQKEVLTYILSHLKEQ